MFETFVFNLGGGVREQMLDGRLYLVARCVMGVEGVLHGSNGAAFYPAKEWEHAVPSWNMKPITNDHPTKDGKPSTAADPEVIANHQLGFLLNTRYDGKLRTEAWFDAQKTQTRCPLVFNALKQGKMIEVSTGLVVDKEVTPGEHKGRKYDWIARNHRPDHLAVLPGKVGACSIADGAGLLANEAITLDNLLVANEELGKLIPQPKEPDVFDKKAAVDSLIANSNGLYVEEHRAKLMAESDDWLKKAVGAFPPKTPAPAPTPAPVPTTVNEWLVKSGAPPEVTYMVNSALEAAAVQKAQLVANIMGHPANKFTKEYLDNLPLPALVGIDAFAKANTPAPATPAPVAGPNGYPILQPNFVGNAGGTPVAASAQPHATMPVLSLPTLNFQPVAVQNGQKK